MPAYKIASLEIVDHPLIDCVSSKLKPILMSTGSADLAEIEDAIWKIKQKNNNQLLLFHCISAYPAKLEESNLNSIRFLKERFNISVEVCQILRLVLKRQYCLLRLVLWLLKNISP